MFETIAGIVYQGLLTYNGADKKKYLKQFKEHMENYYEQLDKPSWEEREDYPNHQLKDFRDNNIIDGAKRGVYILGKAYSTFAGGGESLRDIIKE